MLSPETRSKPNGLYGFRRETTMLSANGLPVAPSGPKNSGSGPAWLVDSRRLPSEEHTSELQSHPDLVCRLLLEKKKKHNSSNPTHTYNHLSLRATYDVSCC